MYNYHCIIKSEFPFSRSVFIFTRCVLDHKKIKKLSGVKEGPALTNSFLRFLH